MFWLELIVVLSCVFAGAHLRGVGLGVMGGIGLFILCFVFHVKPNSPPYNVLLIIISVITAGMALEASNGLLYLTSIAEKVIRKNPNNVTIIAPFVTFIFTVLTGTSHISYSIFPVIADVALKAGIRPERPLSASAVAALQAIIASPISAFTGVALGIFGLHGYTLLTLMKIYLPAAIIGVIACIFVSSKMGKPLFEDPKLKERLKNLTNTDITKITKEHITFKSKLSVIIFFLGIFAVILASIPFFKPSWIVNGKIEYLDPTLTVSIIMLSTSALVMLICNAKPSSMIKGKVALAGLQAVIAILGISWLGNTLFIGNLDYISNMIKEIILQRPWIFCVFLFFVNSITTSQAATLKMLIPLGLAIGLPIQLLIAFLPAINSIFFIPNYPTMVAAIEFDPTGSTRIGKYILNHSFMLPGLAATITTLILSILLSKIML